ncbi:MAG: crotonobetainyl-CoA:carnitine CoA-transferase CaiB-like acyl-CoA transferase [Salinirussus sp.]|jgi:crotonobetainyl-CoA:carnitine CoA-transferase CaiB-like acyl-CoA transferase
MQPFTDIDVLDLTQSIAGPACTQRLATLGADVLKVEPPDGDAFRGLVGGSMFATFNTDGKRSLAVDLKTEEGQELVKDLAHSADVVVESFRPGVTEQFGLDYESVSEHNPEVVYTSVTGFGQDGPYADFPAYDPVIQAMSGLMSVIGYPDRPPVRVGASVIDCATGANAAFMTSAALHEAEHTGEGTHVDISLFDVAAGWMGYWAAKYAETGEVATRHGTTFGGLSPNDIYHAAGDEPFYLCAVNDMLWERTARAVGREDLLEDPRFETNAKRDDHDDALRAELEATFREYDRDELVALFTDAGVPAGPRRDVAELVDEDPHVEAREMLVNVHNLETDSEAHAVRLPVRTTDWVPEFEGQTPGLGEHTREVLREQGYAEAEVEALCETGAVRTADE